MISCSCRVDPHTATKIMIVGSDYLPHLLERIDISQIPEELGGQRSNFGWSVPENVEVSVELMGKAVGGKIHSKCDTREESRAGEQYLGCSESTARLTATITETGTSNESLTHPSGGCACDR